MLIYQNAEGVQRKLGNTCFSLSGLIGCDTVTGLVRNTFESWSTNISFLELGLKPEVFGCLTNAIAPPPIALDSCSKAETDRPIFYVCTRKKIFWLGFADFLWVTS